MLRSVPHRALDGSLVRIQTSLDLERPFSSVLNLRIGSHVQEFVAGALPFAADNAKDLGVEAFREEYRFQGGTLRFGVATQVDPSTRVRSQLLVAAWEGTAYSLYTFAYNTTDSAELLAVLDRTRLTETAEGIALAPVDLSSTPIADVWLLKELPTLGLLMIESPGRAARKRLPAWGGAAVQGGELFVEDGQEARRFVLVGATTVTQVLPDPDDDPNSLLPALAELQVDWVKG